MKRPGMAENNGGELFKAVLIGLDFINRVSDTDIPGHKIYRINLLLK